MRIQVKDFMSSPVTTAMGEHSVLEIRTLMEEKGINAIPIVLYANDTLKLDTTIQGIVTRTDVSNEVNKNATVADVMTTTNVYVVHGNTSAQSAAKMMLKNKVHHIVVMDDGEIIGMISSLDFVKLVAEHTLD